MITYHISSKEFNINNYKDLISFDKGICIVSGKSKAFVSTEFLSYASENKKSNKVSIEDIETIKAEDVKVVLITEIRDAETFKMAVDASKRGLFVISTFGFKVSNVKDVFNKINELNIEGVEDELKSLAHFEYENESLHSEHIIFNSKEDYLKAKNENEEVFCKLKNTFNDLLSELENFKVDTLKNFVNDTVKKLKKEFYKSEKSFEDNIENLLNLSNKKVIKEIENMEMPELKSVRKKQEIIEATRQHIINELKKGSKDE